MAHTNSPAAEPRQSSLGLIAMALVLVTTAARADTRPNVLFIAVDDLRPELTTYGANDVVTPNLDRLTSRGVRFDRAYCMVPTCGASRAALMTGIRPTPDRFLTFSTRADQEAPGVTTLNTHFKRHGYTTISLGKVFHAAVDNASGWSEPPTRPRAETYRTDASREAIATFKKGRTRGPSWENGGDLPDDSYTDGLIANEAVSRLRDLASNPDQPFFLAVGFMKPHLPFVAPCSYFEKNPASKVSLPDNYFPPQDAPPGAVHNSGELRGYSDIPRTGPISEAKALELIRGYRAAMSYTDAQIGRLLDTFDELDLSEDTIVVLWGDHGWNLGEHTLWCKHSCFETSLRAPLVFVTPESMKLSTGAATSSLVEFIDVYPTLCELTGIPQPDHLAGKSVVPILRDPTKTHKTEAISRFKEGDTIRTSQYRYTVYRGPNGEQTGHMLYDHGSDPDENTNIADRPKYAQIVDDLRKRLDAVSKPAADANPPGENQSVSATVPPLAMQLNLTKEQLSKFHSLQQAMTQMRAQLQEMPAEDRKKKQTAFFRERNAELDKLLTAEQMAKLREIRASRSNQQRQANTPQASVVPGQSSTQSAGVTDYSGNDIAGIESIIRELEQGDDPWRQQANARIEANRKADLQLRVLDANSNPLSGAPVRVQLKRHSFRFGGIVGGRSMHEQASGPSDRKIGPEQYKKMFLDLGFNTSGFHSYLKYKRRTQSEPHLPQLFSWFAEHDIPVRGHCLIWPGGVYKNFMPGELSELVYKADPSVPSNSLTKRVPRDRLTAKEQAAVRSVCDRMIAEAASQWPVFEWDVVNETRDNHIVQDLVGRDVLVEWFNLAANQVRNPNSPLYLNENKVISDPAPRDISENVRRFEREVRYLVDHGAPISGLGFQCRFGSTTSPDTIYQRLQHFEQFDLPIAATEFEMKSSVGDELERAAMTEKVMTVLFSHRLVNGIYAWSILAQDQGGAADRAVLEDDGRLKLRGKVWMHLMKQHWSTDESLTTDAKGIVRLRGFKGNYLITIEHDGQPVVKPLRLDNAQSVDIKLD